MRTLYQNMIAKETLEAHKKQFKAFKVKPRSKSNLKK